MSEATTTERKPSAKKTPAKPKEAAPAKSQEQQVKPPVAPEPEYKAPFTKAPVGKSNFELKEVPSELREAAQNRFGRAGVEMQMAPARANGSYKGEVMNSHDFMAQKVGENSVVFHKKADIDLVADKHKWADREKKLNGADLAVHYDGVKAKAYPHDPQREELAKITNVMKKTAENLQLPNLDSFKENMDKVRDAMLVQLKERRQEQAKPKQQERTQEHSR